MPAVVWLVPEVKLLSRSICRALTKPAMVGGNQVSPGSRGETVKCCGGKCAVHLPPPSGPLHLPLLQRSALTHPAPSHSSTNQQICNLSAVMNRGRLPPPAQMDDSGPLKCFLCHSGWHIQGERQWAMLLRFISLFSSDICDCRWQVLKHSPSTWCAESDVYTMR